MINQPGASGKDKPTRVAITAPTTSWPSPPILITPPRKAMQMPKATKSKGVALTMVSATAFGLPKAPSSKDRYASNGLAPKKISITAPTNSAARVAKKGSRISTILRSGDNWREGAFISESQSSSKIVPRAIGGETFNSWCRGRCSRRGITEISQSVNWLLTRSNTAIIMIQGMLLKATTETSG